MKGNVEAWPTCENSEATEERKKIWKKRTASGEMVINDFGSGLSLRMGVHISGPDEAFNVARNAGME
jgi:hypothetical protein